MITHQIDIRTTAINGKPQLVVVDVEIIEKGRVIQTSESEWQGTRERGGMVSFVTGSVIEKHPTVRVVDVFTDSDVPVAIDDVQRDLIAYQITNEMDQDNRFFYEESQL